MTMNRFINILIGWLAFACIIVLGWAGRVLQSRSPQQIVVAEDYLFVGLVVASIFFLQYAMERYLVPPNVFTKEQRKRLLEGAQGFYRKTFFRGAIGISYFFLILYAVEYLRPSDFALARKINEIAYSIFFLILGLLARARGIILHLSEQTGAANKTPISSPTSTGSASRAPDVH